MQHILIVEDDADIREILSFNLEDAGYEVTVSGNAEDGLKKLHPGITLAILDVMLPGKSGFQMAKEMRERGNDIPIIFLTARTSENDILTGFSAGGDDYLGKPFKTSELLARVKAVLRRSAPKDHAGEIIEIGAVRIDRKAAAVSVHNERIELSRKEFQLLELLASHPDTCISRADIIARLWTDAPCVIDRTIDVHIARIRNKLGPCRDLIKNKTGFGYWVDSEYIEK